MSKGEKHWIIPDGYIPPESSGELTSHESVCVLNLSGQDVVVTIHAYFEDRDPLLGMETIVPARRTKHIRTSSLQTAGRQSIPPGIPFPMPWKLRAVHPYLFNTAVSIPHRPRMP